MSDFLTRLVMHAGRAVDVIRPRPLSRFEEPARASHESAEDEIARAIPRHSHRLLDDREERARTAPDLPHAHDSVTIIEQKARDVRPSDRSPEPSPHPTVRIDPPMEVRPPDTRPATHSETIRHETTHTITKVVEQVVRREERAQVRLEDGGSSRTTHDRNTGDRVSTMAPTLAPAPQVKPAVVNAAARAERQAPAPPIAEVGASGGLTVEITIGRVDVRAVMPTAPKRRESRTSTPALSLDDYLQQRGRRT